MFLQHQSQGEAPHLLQQQKPPKQMIFLETVMGYQVEDSV